MKTTYYIFLSLYLISFASCIKKPNEDKQKQNTIMQQNIKNKISVKRNFSSSIHKDLFVLELKGNTYKDAVLDFLVYNDKKDTLFYCSSPLDSVIVDEPKDEETYRTKTLELMSTFFAETNFSAPPYSINDPTKENFPGDTLVWNEIKNNSDHWCFEFTLNHNINKLITYSKTKNTIVVYDYKIN